MTSGLPRRQRRTASASFSPPETSAYDWPSLELVVAVVRHRLLGRRSPSFRDQEIRAEGRLSPGDESASASVPKANPPRGGGAKLSGLPAGSRPGYHRGRQTPRGFMRRGS